MLRRSQEELVEFLLSKWNGINKADRFLSYDLLGAGELNLADEQIPMLGTSGNRTERIGNELFGKIPIFFGTEIWVSIPILKFSES